MRSSLDHLGKDNISRFKRLQIDEETFNGSTDAKTRAEDYFTTPNRLVKTRLKRQKKGVTARRERIESQIQIMEDSLNDSAGSASLDRSNNHLSVVEKSNHMSAFLRVSLDSTMFKGTDPKEAKTAKNESITNLPFFEEPTVKNFIGMKAGKEYYQKFIHFQNMTRIKSQNKSKGSIYMPEGTGDSRTYHDRFNYYMKKIKHDEVDDEKAIIRKEVIRKAKLKQLTDRLLQTSLENQPGKPVKRSRNQQA
jgi:hypothetical protein